MLERVLLTRLGVDAEAPITVRDATVLDQGQHAIEEVDHVAGVHDLRLRRDNVGRHRTGLVVRPVEVEDGRRLEGALANQGLQLLEQDLAPRGVLEIQGPQEVNQLDEP